MPPHPTRFHPPSPLVRAFCPSRLAADALAQSYERLLPPLRRPLPQTPPHAAPPRPSPSRAAVR